MTNSLDDPVGDRRKDELDFVRVGQHTRHVARAPIHKQAQLIHERKDWLIARKREIEGLLSEVANDILEKKAKVVTDRRDIGGSRRKYDQINLEERTRTAPYRKELREIETELIEIRKSVVAPNDKEKSIEMKRKANNTQEAILNCLQRIEGLLRKHFNDDSTVPQTRDET